MHIFFRKSIFILRIVVYNIINNNKNERKNENEKHQNQNIKKHQGDEDERS